MKTLHDSATAVYQTTCDELKTTQLRINLSSCSQTLDATVPCKIVPCGLTNTNKEKVCLHIKFLQVKHRAKYRDRHGMAHQVHPLQDQFIDYNTLFTGLVRSHVFATHAMGSEAITVVTLDLQLYNMAMKLWMEREDIKTTNTVSPW